LAWELVQIFLTANFKTNERFSRRLEKIAVLERENKN
jgi:ribose 5-phosphate isomerase RpiB